MCIRNRYTGLSKSGMDYVVAPGPHSLYAIPVTSAQNEDVIYVTLVIQLGVIVLKTNWHHNRQSLLLAYFQQIPHSWLAFTVGRIPLIKCCMVVSCIRGILAQHFMFHYIIMFQ